MHKHMSLKIRLEDILTQVSDLEIMPFEHMLGMCLDVYYFQ